MQILSPEIQEFIREIKDLNAIGCILVPESGLEKLLSALGKASVIIGPEVQPGRVTYYIRTANQALGSIEKPAILLITEEDYSSSPDWAKEIRELAGYFINLKA